ncbi:MAG TPA: cytochrome B6 [Nitrospiraceae bacterium]|nr:cytochrome B6 [Nitrospiraceae bacterium]
MKRRSFLQLLLSALGVTTLASLLYPLVRYLVPPGTAEKARTLVIAKRDIPLGYAKEIVFNDVPAVVVNRPGKGLIALSRVCTHLGCLVHYDKENRQLLCPCHAGTFDLDGHVISGPPPKPLPVLPLRVDGENIVIG